MDRGVDRGGEHKREQEEVECKRRNDNIRGRGSQREDGD